MNRDDLIVSPAVYPTQVGGALMAAFGERNCIGTYAATGVEIVLYE